MAGDGFPWSVFSANTLRPMMSDIMRANGLPVSLVSNKAQSISLLRKIEKHGLEKALKEYSVDGNASTGAKRKYEEEGEEGEEEEESQSKPKRGRPSRPSVGSSKLKTYSRLRTKRRPEDAEDEEQAEEAEEEEEEEPRPQRKRGRPARRSVSSREISSLSAPPAMSRKRKHDEGVESEEETYSSGSRRKSGRPGKAKVTRTASASPSRPRRGRTATGRTRYAGQSDSGGLLTRRQTAAARGPMRSWKASLRSASASVSRSRSPRKPLPKKLTSGTQKRGRGRPRKDANVGGGAGASASAPVGGPNTGSTKGMVFDGVVLMKMRSPRMGKEREVEQEEPEEEEGVDEEDAEGELVDDDVPEPEEETSSLENSNKENEVTLLEIATAETEPETEGEDLLDVAVEEIGSPAPQIAIEATDDQIEESRLNNTFIPAGSPAPEITIEPMADDDNDAGGVEIEQNGHGHGHGLLRPRIITTREGSVDLNPEYSIEVYSPTSAVHDSDDEMWTAAKINGHTGKEGLRAAGGGLGPLDSLD